jgi:hypothetical protein
MQEADRQPEIGLTPVGDSSDRVRDCFHTVAEAASSDHDGNLATARPGRRRLCPSRYRASELVRDALPIPAARHGRRCRRLPLGQTWLRPQRQTRWISRGRSATDISSRVFPRPPPRRRSRRRLPVSRELARPCPSAHRFRRRHPSGGGTSPLTFPRESGHGYGLRGRGELFHLVG